MSYIIKIETERDWETLHWLAGRGYDGDIVEHSSLEVGGYNDDYEWEPAELHLTEPEAWSVQEAIEADPDAFLSCCGSDSLARALIDFWTSIV